MKYSTFEALRTLVQENAEIVQDTDAFFTGMQQAQENDLQGVSLLRAAMKTDAIHAFQTVSAEQLPLVIGTLARELREDFGMKPYHANWAASAWCAALREPSYYRDEEYIRSLGSLSLNECTELANGDNAYAMLELTSRFLQGTGGVEKMDLAEAERWAKKAAGILYGPGTSVVISREIGDYHDHEEDLEHPDQLPEFYRVMDEQMHFSPSPLCYKVYADMVRKGFGCEQNLEKAFELYKKGLTMDYVNAEGVGLCYLRGEGVEKDVEKAIHYLKLGADHGVSACAAVLYLALKDTKAISDQELFLLARQCAGDEMVEYIYELAFHYLDGRGVEKNEQAGISLLKKAADAGYVPAIREYGRCYLLGRGVPKNDEQGAFYINRAAEKDDREACILMWIYCKTSDNPRNVKLADAYESHARRLGATDEDFELDSNHSDDSELDVKAPLVQELEKRGITLDSYTDYHLKHSNESNESKIYLRLLSLMGQYVGNLRSAAPGAKTYLDQRLIAYLALFYVVGYGSERINTHVVIHMVMIFLALMNSTGNMSMQELIQESSLFNDMITQKRKEVEAQGRHFNVMAGGPKDQDTLAGMYIISQQIKGIDMYPLMTEPLGDFEQRILSELQKM